MTVKKCYDHPRKECKNEPYQKCEDVHYQSCTTKYKKDCHKKYKEVGTILFRSLRFPVRVVVVMWMSATGVQGCALQSLQGQAGVLGRDQTEVQEGSLQEVPRGLPPRG